VQKGILLIFSKYIISYPIALSLNAFFEKIPFLHSLTVISFAMGWTSGDCLPKQKLIKL
jgi:hypothetical protein